MDPALLEEANHWTYHVDFWFPDGNIIVLAGDISAADSSSVSYPDSDSWSSSSTTVELPSPLPSHFSPSAQLSRNVTAFRLHRGILARASPIWADRLDYGTELFDSSGGLTHSEDSWGEFLFGERFRPSGGFGTNTSRVVTPCEVLRLEDDPADLIHVVRALYDGVYFHEDSHTPIARFCVLSSILRVTHRYKIHHLFDAALSCLHADWPTTLRDWDRREDALEIERKKLRSDGYGIEIGDAEAAVAAEHNSSSPSTSGRKWDVYPHPIHVVNLARELGLSDILLGALYELARLRPSEIMLGAKPLRLPEDPDALMSIQSTFKRKIDEECEQETASLPLDAEFSIGSQGETDVGTISAVHLDRADVLLVLTAKERLKEYLSDFIRIVIDRRMIAERCDKVNSERCRGAFRGLCEFVLRKIIGGGSDSGSEVEAYATGGCLASDPLGILRVAAYELIKVRGQTDDGTDALHPSIRGACENCNLEFTVEVAQARERCWDYMHHWFGLQQQTLMDGVDWEVDDGDFEHEHEDEGDD